VHDNADLPEHIEIQHHGCSVSALYSGVIECGPRFNHIDIVCRRTSSRSRQRWDERSLSEMGLHPRLLFFSVDFQCEPFFKNRLHHQAHFFFAWLFQFGFFARVPNLSLAAQIGMRLINSPRNSQISIL